MGMVRGKVSVPQAPQQLGRAARRGNGVARAGRLRPPHSGARERERLAHRLHDTLTQDIWYAALLVEQARAEIEAGAPAGAIRRLEALRGLLAGHYLSARSLIASLRAGNRVVDLEFELHQLLRRVDEVAPGVLRAAIDWEAVAAVADAEMVAGLVRELVTNAVKHSGAASIELTIWAEGEQVRISVVDGGVGLPAADAARQPMLASLRSRVERLGGTCEVVTAPGRGVAVDVRLPRGRS